MSDSYHLPRLAQSGGQEYIVTDKMVIGRSSDCQVQVKEGLVSRRHAMLEINNQRVLLTDLDSNNGTWVNEQRITQPHELRHGDRIRIGETTFTFRSAQSQPVAHQRPTEEDSEAGQTMAWQSASLMTLVRGSDGAEFGLNRSLRIGRDEANELPLKGDASASHFHAIIELSNGQAFVSDLGSNNGTWVNGKRIAGKTPLRHGDKVLMGGTVFRLRVGNAPLPALDAAAAAPQAKSAWIGWAVAGFIGLAALVLVCIFGISLVTLTAPDPTALPQPTAAIAAPTFDVYQAKEEALRALAFIWVPDEDYDSNGAAYSGSGTFINADGYILTNFHVIGVAEIYAKQPGEKTGDLINHLYNGEELILVGINWANPLAKPDTFYRCEIVKSDPYLDLALLRVVEFYNPDTEEYEPLPADLRFPVIPIGNSDDLKILDSITIIGYPGVGGDTPTAIDDQVAGFSPDDYYTDIEKGWIKTGPIVSHGNSGGMAINQYGELIGVPTAQWAEGADKIGYIRPINLALELIQEYLP